MSRKGNCWNNAPMESCCGSLKTELVHHRRFINREQAKREITEHIKTFYNRIRNAGAFGLPVARLASTHCIAQCLDPAVYVPLADVEYPV